MKIAIGCDHVGFEHKDLVVAHLKEPHLKKYDIEILDCGTHSAERTDYPQYGLAVANAIIAKEAELGILICGTGVGISLAANKVAGIRAVVCSEPYTAKLSREHNNTNILAFGSRVIGIELAKMIIDSWLSATFEGGRHANRVNQIIAIENQ